MNFVGSITIKVGNIKGLQHQIGKKIRKFEFVAKAQFFSGKNIKLINKNICRFYSV